jgi:hypothetical protein
MDLIRLMILLAKLVNNNNNTLKVVLWQRMILNETILVREIHKWAHLKRKEKLKLINIVKKLRNQSF